MACKDCEIAQESEGIAYYRWKNANIAIVGCDTHLKEIFGALSDAQDSPDHLRQMVPVSDLIACRARLAALQEAAREVMSNFECVCGDKPTSDKCGYCEDKQILQAALAEPQAVVVFRGKANYQAELIDNVNISGSGFSLNFCANTKEQQDMNGKEFALVVLKGKEC